MVMPSSGFKPLLRDMFLPSSPGSCFTSSMWMTSTLLVLVLHAAAARSWRPCRSADEGIGCWGWGGLLGPGSERSIQAGGREKGGGGALMRADFACMEPCCRNGTGRLARRGERPRCCGTVSSARLSPRSRPREWPDSQGKPLWELVEPWGCSSSPLQECARGACMRGAGGGLAEDERARALCLSLSGTAKKSARRCPTPRALVEPARRDQPSILLAKMEMVGNGQVRS